MNSLAVFLADAPSMTSREIAELVGSRHSNVMTSIERLMASGTISTAAPQVFEEINNLGLPVQRKHYVFSGEQGKRDSIVVVAQLSPEFTARLVDRWQELEKPRTTGDALVSMALAYREHERRIAAIEQEQEVTKQKIAEIVGGEDYATAKGYARTHGLPADRESLNALGRRASAMCRQRGIRPGKVTDEVWGEVNSYPREILKAAAEELQG
jgi:phage regulator Rha-like protein